MRRRTVLAASVAVPALAGWLMFHLTSTAQTGGHEPTASAKLPVKKVVLFSSGVGYFQRTGEIDGNAKVDLTFPAGDINDLLKSLTLEDQGGGHVQTVGYDSHDPVERTLKSYAIDLSDNPAQAQILDRARGEKVEVTLNSGPGITGAIIGVEKTEVPVKDGKMTVESLNLLTTEGLRSVKLSDMQRVRFLNQTLETELRRALETLTLSHDAQKKAVTLKFAGSGRRPVRVSYVVENPIWKTSYRMVLDQAGKPYLQGWAVVENPTDEDWTDVRMALVSGRPISFKMDLYSPLYVPRPTVEPELFASLRPPTYDGSMEKGFQYGIPPFAGGGGPAGAPAPAAAELRSRATPRRGDDAAKLQLQKSLNRVTEATDKDAFLTDLDLTRGVNSAAVGAQLGDYFQYTIEEPISIARQKSAMLPIVTKEIEGSRVSIYNPRTHAKYPLLGVRFKNTSGVSLMQGPVTVLDGSSYAGDARMPDLQPGEDRLVSYAIDLGTEVEAKSKAGAANYTSIKVAKGILWATRKIHEERSYEAVNRSKTDRTLLIEHPYRADYRLAGNAKPAERTRDLYRFELKLPAGQKGQVDVVEEKDLDQTVELLNTNEQQILFYIRMPAISPKVKAALEEAVSLRSKWAAVQHDLAGVNKQLADITKEQERLRANLKELPPTAAAYKRYLEKFDAQETQIERLQAEQKKLTDAEQAAHAKYEQYVTTLSVE
ncbi:MAG: DUF4139 domain-containing protein [Gemmataceae bacterium]